MASSTIFCDNCGAANHLHALSCYTCNHSLQAFEATSRNTATERLLTNQFLKGRYRILASVGEGGMGAVYKAEDTQLGNRTVAIKAMSQRNLSPQEVAEATDAFQREAHILARLQHPNLPSIYDYFPEGRHWYLVMSFIQGETLETLLAKAHGGKLPVEKVLHISIQLCTVLDYLHTHQPPIIFRDLKPSNVMLTRDDHLYLIDFGIARHFKAGQSKDTAAYGSAGYSSPEQYGKAQTAPQSDIYSLGALMHQMLSGNDPSHNAFFFAPLQTLEQPALAELETLMMSMVELNIQKRPCSAAMVKQNLERIKGKMQHNSSSRIAWANGSQTESPSRRIYTPQPQPQPQPQPPVYFPQQRGYAPQQREQPSLLSSQQQLEYAPQQRERPSFFSSQMYQPVPLYIGNSYYAPSIRQPINGMAIAGFILGILGLFTSWMLIGVPFSLIGLILSLLGIVYREGRNSEGKELAIAGLIFSIIAILIALAIYAPLFILAFM
jgi:serine/threonine protein kinase